LLDATHVTGIPKLQIFVANALAAGEQTVGKLLWIKMDVALDLLKPLHTIARGTLQLQGFDLAVFLIELQGFGDVAFVTGHHISQRHSVFHGQFRARADAEMGGVRSIADQNDVFVMPFFTQYTSKL
jgi:hypothetical protein